MYCSHCGAPQIFLSEELRDQIARDASVYSERAAQGAAGEDGTEAESDAGSLPGVRIRRADAAPLWRTAISYALLSAGISFAFCLVSAFFPPLGIFAWLWVISAPILTVGFVNSRSGGRAANSGFAARVGLLTGLLVALSCLLVVTLALLLTRFVFHHADAIDGQVAGTFDQAAKNAVARFGPAVQPGLEILRIPEFRVGLMLWMAGVGTVCYLFVSTVAAGLAGILLRRRRSL